MISKDHEHIQLATPRGTWVAHPMVVRGLAALCVLSMGCIVTEEIDFPVEPDCPPSIVSRPGAAPIGLVSVDRLVASSDGGVGGMATFEVDVRDCNVEEELQYEVWLDYRVFGGVITGTPLHITSDEEGPRTLRPSGSSVRELLFPVDPTIFDTRPGAECHKVELFVTGGFQTIRVPRKAGDLDVATWYVVEGDPREVTSLDCEQAL